MRQTQFSHQVVDFIPEQLAEGVLYVSLRYGTALHKCACGCGEEVVTPLNPSDWSIQINKCGVTLYPSIGNWSFACQSHYWIRKSKVVWAGRMTRSQIERGRAIDHQVKEQYFAEVNQEKGLDRQSRSSFPQRMWETIMRWWNT